MRMFLSAAVLSASTVLALPPTDGATAGSSSAITLAPVDEDCRRCEETVSPVEHRFAGAGVWYKGNTHIAWVAGGCTNSGGSHTECEECEITHSCLPCSEGDCLAPILAAVSAGDAGRIDEIASSRPLLRLNATRRALQLFDCSGAMLAHYPIGDGLARELVARGLVNALD